MRGLAAALLLALSVAAHADVQVFERIEWQAPRWQGPENRVAVVDQFEWTPVSLPHTWFRDLPPIFTGVWYRARFHLDHAPTSGQSLYLPKVNLLDLSVYVNRHQVWTLTDVYRPGVPLNAVRIPIPANFLQDGENTIHLQAFGAPKFFHGLSRVYFGDTAALSEVAATRSLIQDQLANIVAAAFGAIGLLSLGLWFRAGRDPVLFWYGVSGVTLLAATALWLVSMYRPEFFGWRLGLLFMRFHGYLVPFFILHMRIAGRRHVWLEGALWIVLAFAFLRISSTTGSGAHSWFGWGMVFSLLPALLTIPLLATPSLRSRPSVRLLIAADLAACMLPLHDWATRLGLLDFDQPLLVSLAPPFVMLAAAVPILERMLAGAKATAQMNVELERRVAAKAREIEASHAQLRVAQREQELAEERRRIMADMHDGLGARLVSLLSVAQSGKAKHGEISEGIAAALDELRLTVDSVQPVEGDVNVVLGNVRHRMRSVFERSGVQLVWNVSELPRMDNLTPERILSIQRIFLEAFANTLRHSGARTVSVFTMRVPGAIRIVIEDDGRGFDALAPHAGMGLHNLQTRARQAGGTLEVRSNEGKGTRLTLSLALDGGDTADALPTIGHESADYPVQGIAEDAASS